MSIESESNPSVPPQRPEASQFEEPVAELIARRVVSPPVNPGQLGSLDRFQILEHLGEGGMGVVLLARDPNSGQKVAIKLVKPDLVANQQIVARFLREARHLQQLKHENVVEVLEISDRPQGPYFVMPYFEKGSLANRIAQGKSLDREFTLQTALQLAEGLRFAHRRGIVHRDLKPANILLAADGKVCIADFGLAREMANESIVDPDLPRIEGTLSYMSPQVADGAAPDYRGDIYALGAVLYEMLTGVAPYTGTDAQEIKQKIKAGPPKRILSVNPKSDRVLATVSEWALARDLRDRYAETADILEDLQRIKRSQSPRGPHWDRFRLALRRASVPAACLAVVLMLIFGLLRLWPKMELTVVSNFSSPQVLKWDGVTLGHWNRPESSDFCITEGGKFLVFNGQGQPLTEWSPNRPGVQGFAVNMAEDLEGFGLDDAVLSWSEGPQLTMTVLNQHRFPLKTYQIEGRAPDPRNIGATSRIGAQKIVKVGHGPGARRSLLAFLWTAYGGSPRGLCCFDFDTQQLLWKYLIGPMPTGLEVLDLGGNGGTDYVFGSASVSNGNLGPDGTDDSHGYIFAVSSDGKPLWKLQLAGALAMVNPLAIDFDGTGKKELLAWVHTGEFAHQTNAPEVGLIVKLDAKGQIVAQTNIGACLVSCLAADLEGDHKEEILCSDCEGRVHVLNKDLSLRRKVELLPPQKGGVVDLRIVAVTKLRTGNRPQVVLCSSRYPQIPELISGKPTDSTSQAIRDENAVLVLDSELRPIATYLVGTNWTVDMYWDVKVGDVLGNGKAQILSLTDHVEVLQLTR
jgi:serine/threonine protein kinase